MENDPKCCDAKDFSKMLLLSYREREGSAAHLELKETEYVAV